MPEYSRAIETVFSFSMRPRNWLPLFAVYAIHTLFFIFLIMWKLDVITSVFSSAIAAKNPLLLLPLLKIGLAIFAAFIVSSLAALWIKGAVVFASAAGKRVQDGLEVSKANFISLLLAGVTIAVISGMARIMPFIGWLLEIIVFLAFYFYMQSIITGKKGIIGSLEESVSMFRDNPLPVFIISILLGLLEFLILLVFGLPLLYVVLSKFLPLYPWAGSLTADFIPVFRQLFQDTAALTIAAVIAAAGAAVSDVFVLKAQTDFYREMKARAGPKR